MSATTDKTGDLTTASAALLEKIRLEAQEWDGAEAYFTAGELSKAEAGNLLDLKRKGLVSTQEADRGAFWVILHPEGA